MRDNREEADKKILEPAGDVCGYRYMDPLFREQYIAMDTAEIPYMESLRVVRAEHAVILPMRRTGGSLQGGVVGENGKYEELSAFRALSEVDCWGGGAYPYDGQQTEYRDCSVIYMGRFWKHWGHFLMDMLPRLWYVLENESALPIAYDGDAEPDGVYLEVLKLLGIEPGRLLRVDRPMRFAGVIIPECACEPGLSYSPKWKGMFDTIVENCMKDNPFIEKYAGKRVYLTRRQLNRRVPMEVGEDEIEDFFAGNGFVIAAPEKCSFPEQVALLQTAEEIACVSGTLPHNLVFARDGMPVTIIRKSNKPVYRQVTVNRMRDLRVTNVDAHISPRAVGPSGPFILDINENVVRYAEDNSMKLTETVRERRLKRIKKLLWYIPVYYARNRGKDRGVPLFRDGVFVSDKAAEKELRRFYMRRIRGQGS